MKKRIIRINVYFLFICGLMLTASCTHVDAPADVSRYVHGQETVTERDARMAWWREARFGLFIHWGVYAVPAGEWDGEPVKGIAEWIQSKAEIPVKDYEPLKDQFNPVQYDADAWVRLAKNAGMKYIVITSKHHDGFCLWDSAYTDWDIASTPYKKDLLKSLAEACEKHGIRLCFYHSIMDWRHPDWGVKKPWRGNADNPNPDMDVYTDYMKAQLKELLTGYGDIGVLWFDGEWEGAWTHERGVDLDDYLRGIKPSLIINNRVDKGRKGFKGMNKEGDFRGDFGTPEQEIPPTGFPGVDWESCMTMNKSWGYKASDENWKSTEMLIRNLVDIASKGGNYLLNVGPTAEGLIPQPSVERLKEIGAWMKVNGDSIYGTTASPCKRPTWGRITTRALDGNTTLYLHVFEWPEEGGLFLPIGNPVQECRLLADTDRIFKTSVTEDGITVHVTGRAPDPISSVVMLKIKGAPSVTAADWIRQREDGCVLLSAERAVVHAGHGHSAEYEKDKDCIGRWTSDRVSVDWEFSMTTPGIYTLSAPVAAEKESGFEVKLAGQSLKTKVPATGSWNSFKELEIGTFKLDAGIHMLTVSPIEDDWNPVNLKSPLLTPLGE